MKRFVYAVMAVCSMLGTISCGSQKKAAKSAAAVNPGEEVVNLVFVEPQYKSDSRFFRDHSSGISSDLAAAKKIAVQNTRMALGAMVESTIKLLVENYGNTENMDSQVVVDGSTYEELGKTIVDTQLNGLEIVDEKAFKLADGTYRYHVCMQLSKDNIIKAMDEALETDARLKMSKDKEKFREYFSKHIR